eukprot:1195068-Rhodomonas_salina.1
MVQAQEQEGSLILSTSAHGGHSVATKRGTDRAWPGREGGREERRKEGREGEERRERFKGSELSRGRARDRGTQTRLMSNSRVRL